LSQWDEAPRLDRDTMAILIQELLGDYHCQQLKQGLQVDAGYGHPELGRFRVNVFYQRGEMQAALRLIPPRVRPIRDLSLPPVIERIASERRGLVLVTGTTGSGKSTTLAAMIDHINRTADRHIITIEDPIEYLHRDEQSIVTQREIGADCVSFAAGLKGALRQDPDVILVGEMRDLETIETAILAAETGHLVMSTLHTLDAPETVTRVISAFPDHQRGQARLILHQRRALGRLRQGAGGNCGGADQGRPLLAAAGHARRRRRSTWRRGSCGARPRPRLGWKRGSSPSATGARPRRPPLPAAASSATSATLPSPTSAPVR